VRVQSLKIILLCIASAVIYGVVHDQITARVCVEYFTIGHPPVFGTDSPTLLGLGWGVIATWWVGLILGVPLAAAARAGGRPKRSAGSLMKPVGFLLAVMGCCALAAGVVGYAFARNGAMVLLGPIADAVPEDRHVRFIADLWAHLASYIVGFVGGLVLIVLTWKRRGPSGASP
jgi:hypothetical protein